jgi:ubiquitin carboxyl-terminal hydrolase 40
MFVMLSIAQEISNEYFVYPVEVEKNQKLFQVKHQILLQLNISDIFGGGRLRIDDDIQGLGPPLCEELGVMDAGIQPGMRVVLEPGPAPLSNQISLRFKVKGMTSEFNDVILNKKCTIQECCHVMVASAGLQGDDWHLCKGNWCGEETGNVLDDEMATIEEAKLYDGDYVVVENGRLPPKGYIRISVYLYVLDKVVGVADEETATPTSILDYQQVGIEAMDSVTLSSEDNKMKATGDGMDCPLHEVDPAIYYPPVYGSLQLLGDIEINKESSIQNLKEHILTLPHLDGLDVPTTDFIRVRELTNGGRPGRVFKDQSISLK